MDLGIAGKKALVIGGSAGLGLACGEALAAEGVELGIVARNAATLEKVCTDLTDRFGVAAVPHAADVTDRAQVRALADGLRAEGGLDILVVNTPRPPSPMRDFLDEKDDDRWDAGYRDQLDCPISVLRAMTPLLLGRGWGRIIGLTSASVKQPMPRHAISTIYRAGMQAALKHLVDEVGPHGVTVNAVAPATVITPTFANFHDLEARIAAIPLKRPGKPAELGATVAFLASDHAGFITGQVIQFDGGMTRTLV